VTWTYDGAPGTSTAAQRRDSVRFLTGDTDTTDQQVTDEEIAFTLSQSNDQIYSAGAATARAIAAKYSRLVNTSHESLRADYSNRQAHYLQLAQRLDAAQASTGGALTHKAGGISIDEMESVREDDDRPKPFFEWGQFENPPRYQIDGDDDRTF